MPTRRPLRVTDLPKEIIDKISEHTLTPSNLRRTSRTFKKVPGNAAFEMLEQHEQKDHESMCFSQSKSLVKVDLLRAMRTRQLELKLNPNCASIYPQMYDLLKHVCDRLVKLSINAHRINLNITDLLKEIVSERNNISVLIIKGQNIEVMEEICENYPTPQKLTLIGVCLPKCLVELDEVETVFEENWFPNQVQRNLTDVFSKNDFSSLKKVHVLHSDLQKIIIDRQGLLRVPQDVEEDEDIKLNGFSFGFQRDEDGRIIDYA